MIQLKYETIWIEQRKYEEAESRFHRSQSASSPSSVTADQGPQRPSIVDQIAKARETIQQTLKGESGPTSEPSDGNVVKRLSSLEKENQQLKETIDKIQASLAELEKRVSGIEISKVDNKSEDKTSIPNEPSLKPEKKEDDDDDDSDDDDLFGSDDDEEAEKLKEIRKAQYAEKKAKKPAVTAKSNIILDIKPWDDETDMGDIEKKVRSIVFDGLLWGASKLVAIGYGIKKLQISCVVEDDKVSTDDLEEAITAFEDHIQSMDIAAFNKV